MDGEWLTKAIGLARQGKKEEARIILQDLVKQEPNNPQAWLWLADTMPTLAERVGILRDGLRNNPGHAVIQRALTSLVPQAGQPELPTSPPDARPTKAFSLSTGELMALDQQVGQVPEERPADDDWLRSLSLENRPLPAAAKPDPRPVESKTPPQPPAPVHEEIPAATVEDRSVADWLANLDHDEPKKSGQSSTKQSSVKQSPGAGQPPPEWLAPLHKEPEKEERPAAVSDEEADEPAPRRRWLGVVLVVILAAVLVGLAVMAWPLIQPMIFPPSAAAPTEPVGGVAIAASETPTSLPTRTPSPAPTQTFTPSVTPTRTITTGPTITLTPVPALLTAGLAAPANIQQFKSLASVKAKGCVALGNYLLAAVVDAKNVQIWDFLTGAVRAELSGPKAAIQQIAFSPDGKLAAAASEDPAVWVWDIEKKTVVATLEFSTDLAALYKENDFPRSLQVQFSPDGKTVFASSILGVSWWDLQTRQERHTYPLLPTELKTFREQALRPVGKNATSFLIAFRPDGKAFAAGSPSKVFIFSWPGAGGLATLTTNKPLVALDWIDNGLLGITHPGQVNLWNTLLNKQILSFTALKSQPVDLPPNVSFQPNGKLMAIDSDNSRGLPGGLRLISLPDGKELMVLDPQTNSTVENPVISPDGKLVFGRSGGDMFVWDTSNGKLLRRIANRRGFSEISADGKLYLEVGTVDTSIWGILQP